VKRRTSAVFLIALMLLGLAPNLGTKASDTSGTSGNPALIRHLTNGLTVAVIEDHSAPVVDVTMYYNCGSLDESQGKTGLAHSLEHMMFRGTAALSGAALQSLVEQLGDEANADTSEDLTRFVTLVPANQFDVILEVEADRMRGLLLRESDWKLERQAVLAEMDERQGQPDTLLSEAVRRALFAGSPFAHDPLGDRRDVMSLTTSDLRTFYRQYYVPNNALLVITGDVDREVAYQRAVAHFSEIPAGDSHFSRIPDAQGHATRSKISVRGDSPQAIVDEAFRMPGDLAGDSAAASAFADAMENDNSPFRQLITDQLALNIDVDTETTARFGIMHVVLWLRPEARPDAVDRAFRHILSEIVARGLDPELLSASKIRTATDSLLAGDSVSDLNDRYGYPLASEGHDPKQDDAEAARLDSQAMRRVITRWFSHPAITGVLLPTGTGKRIVRSEKSTTIHDRFPGRVSREPILFPTWAHDALANKPIPISKLNPVPSILRNGLRLFVQPVPGVSTVVIKGAVEVDPRDDPPGKEGTGRLLSTLMRDGSWHYDPDEQSLVSDELGADIDFGFSFGAHGRASDMNRFIDVLSDALRFPSLPPPYVDEERNGFQDATTAEARDPDAIAERALDRALYAPGDPALRTETRASIDAIGIADLAQFEERSVRPDRTILVVVGDVDPRDVRTAVERAFGDWTSRGVARPVVLPPLPPTKPIRIVVPADRDVSTVILAKRAVGMDDPAYVDLVLLDAILGADGRAGTRLMSSLRTQRGLVYEAGSGLESSPSRGILRIEFKTHRGSIPVAESIAREAIRDLEARPVSTAELADVKRILVTSEIVSEESTQAMAETILALARLHRPPDYYRHFAEAIAPRTPIQLQTAARRIFGSDAFAEAIVGRVTPVTPRNPSARKSIRADN